MPTPPANDDFRPTARWQHLRRRAELLAQLRAFFAARNYVEVETPLLSADSVVDRHLDPFITVYAPDPRQPDAGKRLFLQTSPEAGMKRLLAACPEATAIYQVTRSFRNGELGPLHNPEFTLVEWYRVGDGMPEQIELLAELCCELLPGRGTPADVERVSYAEAFQRYLQIDPLSAAAVDLIERAEQLGIATPPGLAQDDRDGWLDLLLVERAQPHLGVGHPTILHSYPPSQAALARVSGDPPIAERFELYVDGIELANGYHELLDASVLRQRTLEQNRLRCDDGKPALPEDGRLPQAMDFGLPPCSGVALGFDRLVMLAVGATSLAEVLPFPLDRA